MKTDQSRRGFFKAIAATVAAAALRPLVTLLPAAAEPVGYVFTQDELEASRFMISQLTYGEARAFQRFYASTDWSALISDL